MSDRFTLPEGYADLRTAEKIPERLRRPIRQASFAIQRGVAATMEPVVEVKDATEDEIPEQQAAFGAPPIDAIAALADEGRPEDGPRPVVVIPSVEQVDLVDQLHELMIVGFVEAWSFFDGVVNVENVRDLPGDVYDALRAECDRRNKPDDVATEETPTTP